jgi:molecular chaperone DnaJ
MAGKDYYAILGVKRDVTDKDIKASYRRLARKFHPDVNPGDKTAEARFKEINEAYEVLSDAEKRKKYDQYGDNWQNAEQFAKAGGQPFGGQPFGGQPFTTGTTDFGQGQTFHFENGNINDIFGDLFGGRPGGNTFTRNTTTRARKGQDVEYQVEVTLEESYSGTTRMLAMEQDQACPSCNGTGHVQNVVCSVCRGTGVVAGSKRLEVKIPTGVDNGSRVRVAGKGEPGYAGAQAGDLYLVISLRQHPVFERKGDDLLVDVNVPLTKAVLGGEVEVTTIKGKLALRIPPETQNGRVFRLTGQGMPRLGSTARGDLLARIKVVLPTGLSSEEKRLFEQLSQLRRGG